MKNIFSLFTITLLLLSCKDLDKRIYATNKKGITTMQLFFPVTSFIKGEIYTIKKNGINPLKYTTINDRTDSVWLKVEDIDTALSAFLQAKCLRSLQTLPELCHMKEFQNLARSLRGTKAPPSPL